MGSRPPLTIEHVESLPFGMDMGRRIGDANGVVSGTVRPASAVLVHCAGGIVGVALAGTVDVDRYAPLLAGRDAHGGLGAMHDLRRQVFKAGYEGEHRWALGAIDTALWDARAKHAGLPLWRLLGGSDPKVPAYASALDFGLSDGEFQDVYGEYAEAGFAAAKIKVDVDIDRAIRRLSLVSEILARPGVKPGLMIDANESWTPKQAVSIVRQIEREFDLLWVEEPVSRRDAVGLRQVSDSIAASVASGENLTSVHDFVPLLAHGVPDVIQFGGTTGITGYLQVAALADAHSRPISSVNSHWAMAHAATVAYTQSMVEVSHLSPRPPLRFACEVHDGFVHLSSEPGIGLEVDLDTLASHPVPAGPDPGGLHGRRPDAGRLLPPDPHADKRLGDQ